MSIDTAASRRRFLVTGCLAAGLVLPVLSSTTASAKKKEEEVSPAEDLMREHGVLRRVLLIYEEVLRRTGENTEVPPGVVKESAEIIRHFIEDYHEKLEEDEIFPRFEKAGKLTGLVRVLKEQHQAGRRLTAAILQASTSAETLKPEDWKKIAANMREFIRMYRPHAAREDTVLFPALPSVISRKELNTMGDRFEDREHKLFGKEGFENMVGAVAELERKLNIYELSRFTPQE